MFEASKAAVSAQCTSCCSPNAVGRFCCDILVFAVWYILPALIPFFMFLTYVGMGRALRGLLHAHYVAA